jgi:alanine dehydrogenase
MPGAVPHTSTYALTNATLPYALALAGKGFAEAVAGDKTLARGVNVYAERVTNAAVAAAHGMQYTPLESQTGGR